MFINCDNCDKLLQIIILAKMEVKMLNKKTILSLLMSSIFTLTACQSLPNTTTKPNQLTAHALMKHAMLHRFDKSYDYEKSTHYTVDTLYQKNDIEHQDVSVFLSLVQEFNNRFKDTETLHDLRPERLACESEFHKGYNQALKPFFKDEITNLNQINESLEKVIAIYDSCMAELPLLSEQPQKVVALDNNDVSKICSENLNKNLEKNNENAFEIYLDCLLKSSDADNTAVDDSLEYAQNFETLRDYSSVVTAVKASSDEHDYTTIDSIIEKEPSVYQMTLTKMIEKLKEIDENNQKIFPNTGETPSFSKLNKSDIGKMLVNMRLTAEQIELINHAYLKPQQIRYHGSYDKSLGQFSTVVEEIKETPYSHAYKRIPMLLDFNEMSVIFEPDVALPLLGLLFDKELPDLNGKSIKFTLPDNLRQNIPLSMIKNSVFKALGQAYGDLNPEKFSEVIPDDYAKSIHASRVIKINLSTHDIGFIIGRSLKYFAKDLQNISEKHPEFIKNNEDFKLTLEFLQSLNKIYRADDLAKLSQLMEIIMPLSYNSFNYYYFDNQNNLIGYRKMSDYQSSLFNAKAQSITTNQFNYKTLEKHRYYQPKSDEVIDGNALFKNYTDHKKRENEARDARFGYTLDDVVGVEALPDAVIDAQNDKAKKDE